MANYDGLRPGQILADASVAEFIKSLGLGIAEAQRALDENSIDQISEFIEPRAGLDGKTLLDMGLSPAFYHYQYADISCSLQLSLKVEKNFSTRLHINGSVNSKSSESGTQLRQAELDITVGATGILTVKDNNFPLEANVSHSQRMRNLQTALLDDSADISMAFYHLNLSELDITTTATTEKVHVTNNTIAFIKGSSDSGIIRIANNDNIDYKLNESISVNTTIQSDLETYATHVETEINNLENYSAKLFKPNSSIFSIEFDTSSATIADDDLKNISEKLLIIALAIKSESFEVVIEGFTDRQGNKDFNQTLSDNRANYLKQLLIANSVSASKITTESKGEDAATNAGDGTGIDNQDFRKATIKIKDSNYFWLFIDGGAITNPTPNMFGDNSKKNGFTFIYNPSLLELGDKSVSIDGATFDLNGAAGSGAASGSAETYAYNLSTNINENNNLDIIATPVANITTITKKSDQYHWTLATLDPREIRLDGNDGITIKKPFSKPFKATTSGHSKPKTGNRSVAFGASLDISYSRKFEMSVMGNSSISARLVSIPAPPEFLSTIKEFLNNDNGG